VKVRNVGDLQEQIITASIEITPQKIHTVLLDKEKPLSIFFGVNGGRIEHILQQLYQKSNIAHGSRRMRYLYHRNLV
jgi:thiamine pyrophosphokinase